MSERVITFPCLPWQAEAFAFSEKEAVVIGGVGSGKSIYGADWLIERAVEFPHAHHYYMGATKPAMREGTTVTLCSRLDDYGFDYDLNRSDLNVTITSGPGKGARLIATSAETYIRLKGQIIDSMWADEAQTWRNGGNGGGMAYDFILTRLRPSEAAQKHHPDCHPQIRLTANPPHSTGHWLYTKFVSQAGAKLWQVTTFDNHLLPQRDEYIETLRRALSPELFAIEVMGEWGDLNVGRAYRSFNQRKHVQGGMDCPVPENSPWWGYDPALPLVWTHDFGVDPRVSLVCQVHVSRLPFTQSQVVVVLKEYRIRDGSTQEMIRQFVEDWPAAQFPRVQLYGDPAGQARNTATGESDWQMIDRDPRLRAYVMTNHRKKASPLIKDRVNAMNTRFQNEKGDVAIVVRKDCPHLIEDLQQTRWKEGSTQLDHGSPSKGILRTHLSDALGYFIEMEWPLMRAATRVIGHGVTFR